MTNTTVIRRKEMDSGWKVWGGTISSVVQVSEDGLRAGRGGGNGHSCPLVDQGNFYSKSWFIKNVLGLQMCLSEIMCKVDLFAWQGMGLEDTKVGWSMWDLRSCWAVIPNGGLGTIIKLMSEMGWCKRMTYDTRGRRRLVFKSFFWTKVTFLTEIYLFALICFKYMFCVNSNV